MKPLPWPKPMPWPKPEPQPKPGEDSLFDDIDWMAFSHDQLYDMVHQGLDVTGANAIAAKWAALGNALQEIGDDLADALAASLEAWQGPAADQARGSMSALSTWAREAGITANEVSGLVSIEASNAENARRSMPEPMATFYPAIPIAAHGTAPMSAAFESAVDIVKDPHGPTKQQHAAHQEAARVMNQFQRASQEVYGTVPQFSPPVTRAPFRIPEEPPPPRIPDPQPSPQPPVTPPASSNPVPPSTGGSGGDAGRAPVVGGPSGGVPVHPVEPPARPMTPVPGVGAAPPAPEEARPAPRGGAPAAPAASGGGGMGMAPMGAAGGKEEDQERKAPKYLEGDADLFRIKDRLAPPVIGEDDSGA